MKEKTQNQKKPATALARITGSPADMHQMFGANEGSLANLRSRKQGPPYYKVGKKIFYRISEFERWITDNPVLTTHSLPSCQCGGACND